MESSAISKVWSELFERSTLSGEDLFAAVKMGKEVGVVLINGVLLEDSVDTAYIIIMHI